MKRYSLAAMMIALAAGCSSKKMDEPKTVAGSSPLTQTAAPVSIPAPPRNSTLPAGSLLSVRLLNSVSSSMNAPGSPVAAELAAPLVVAGRTIANIGSAVTGIVSESSPGGRIKGVAHIALRLTEVRLNDGRTLALSTDAPVFYARKTVKRDVIAVGITSGIGSAIGAIAGGGKGAAIGAGAGAGAGTVGVLATHGVAAVAPAESVIQFRLRNSVTVPGN